MSLDLWRFKETQKRKHKYLIRAVKIFNLGHPQSAATAHVFCNVAVAARKANCFLIKKGFILNATPLAYNAPEP